MSSAEGVEGIGLGGKVVELVWIGFKGVQDVDVVNIGELSERQFAAG